VQHDVVLHQAVQRQLTLVVHVDLCWLQTYRARQDAGRGRCRTRCNMLRGARQVQHPCVHRTQA
jgi:hypothetical protein